MLQEAISSKKIKKNKKICCHLECGLTKRAGSGSVQNVRDPELCVKGRNTVAQSIKQILKFHAKRIRGTCVPAGSPPSLSCLFSWDKH
jgi:hypothetical protein